MFLSPMSTNSGWLVARRVAFGVGELLAMTNAERN